MYLEGVEKSVQAAKKSPECLNLFGLTMEMVEPPRARKFEAMGETKGTLTMQNMRSVKNNFLLILLYCLKYLKLHGTKQ